jgi:hypothetical protein
MTTFLLAFGFLLIIVAAMAIGAIVQNKPIKGSCGGLAALGMGRDCEICGGDRTRCDEVNSDTDIAGSDTAKAEFYEADRKF